jgi:hypothetical protein
MHHVIRAWLIDLREGHCQKVGEKRSEPNLTIVVDYLPHLEENLEYKSEKWIKKDAPSKGTHFYYSKIFSTNQEIYLNLPHSKKWMTPRILYKNYYVLPKNWFLSPCTVLEWKYRKRKYLLSITEKRERMFCFDYFGKRPSPPPPQKKVS